MKKVEIYINASFGCHQCSSYTMEIEVDDDASEDDIREEVDATVYEVVNWGYEVVGG